MLSPQILIYPAENSTLTIDCTNLVESIVNKATSIQNDKALTGLTEELKKMPHPQKKILQKNCQGQN